MKTRSFLAPILAKLVLLAAVASLGGCASTMQNLDDRMDRARNPSAADPFEPFNRQVFRFNDAVDTAVLRPTAEAYRRVVPSTVRTGVNNFFGNLTEVWSFANSVAQLKLQNSAETFMRFNVNTVFGLGGLLDIATEAGIDRHQEDFGQTLGRWGVPSGPYLVLPLLGPSTVRDTAALTLDRQGDLLNAVNDIPVRNSMYVLRLVDLRASLLRAGQLLDDAALDKYSFTRDAFLQRRRNDVYDGNIPNPDAEGQ
ncbi:Phospholipid-binding lipoprotein MlaA [Burkholderiales bacterium 8X]|nr:Phospholipid-binding lipoprotein MlaA [Burkholderiales bacterium 8X]